MACILKVHLNEETMRRRTRVDQEDARICNFLFTDKSHKSAGQQSPCSRNPFASRKAVVGWLCRADHVDGKVVLFLGVSGESWGKSELYTYIYESVALLYIVCTFFRFARFHPPATFLILIYYNLLSVTLYRLEIHLYPSHSIFLRLFPSILTLLPFLNLGTFKSNSPLILLEMGE